jgi:hypothetical protein
VIGKIVMEDQIDRSVRTENGCFTVMICGLLMLVGVVGIAIGLSELGESPSDWGANYRRGLPSLVTGVCDLIAALALATGLRRRAALLLVVSILSRPLCAAMITWEGFDPGWIHLGPTSGGLETIALILSLWLHKKSPAPNNSFKPTPLRGVDKAS